MVGPLTGGSDDGPVSHAVVRVEGRRSQCGRRPRNPGMPLGRGEGPSTRPGRPSLSQPEVVASGVSSSVTAPYSAFLVVR